MGEQVYCVYPVGHPTIITESFRDVEDYFGIIQCRVIPPRNLYLPVLPYRWCRKKLMFPLCRTCALLQLQTPCTHRRRASSCRNVGNGGSQNWRKRKESYRVTHIYEVYHFQASSTSLFRSYIDLFLKIKQESSGWPSECVTEEARLKYIRQYEEREGVKLDAGKISKNPGRRQVAKLALNSFWGRWGMNVNKAQLTYVHTVPDFNKMLADSTKKIKDVFLPTSEVIAICWESAKEFVLHDASTNIFLATFTTAWARLKLFSKMEKLDRDVLYHDTDSITYASNGCNDPPLGNFLGEFTDELEGDVITTFVSGGPKTYAYQMATGKTCLQSPRIFIELSGIPQLLNFESH
ncbi:uncharacterized protein LOC118200665 [Stegodyphus dumicola]|uniref:uncharacterized protein LOC118200665 n=1 Tax=Stegodyphus dumicola TaxID=202533 RepID=UPI0015B21111|nr:uncharacterized protein LOC118200665 [Stegodyphus dumicola]